MEVREMRDAKPVELRRQAGSGSSRTRSRTQPASNQPYAATSAATAAIPTTSQSGERQTSSFSRTG